jgi:acyl dehydratase
MSVTTYSTAPSLLPLYAKAVALGRLHHGASLPDSSALLADQRVDGEQLAAYQRLCGFRVSAVLPPTFLHVVAFPLTVALLVRRSFPFALMGLVHVANTITIARPVTANEAVTFLVSTADLRAHPAGQQFDVTVEATVDGEAVWTGCSTYLRRSARPTGSGDRSRAQPVVRASGQAALVRVPRDLGRSYGALSGDRNPIHLSGLTAKALGFSGAIAHGMWVKARALAALEGRLPPALQVEVSFKTPVLLPSTIAIATERAEDGWTLEVADARSGKPHLSGSLASLR